MPGEAGNVLAALLNLLLACFFKRISVDHYHSCINILLPLENVFLWGLADNTRQDRFFSCVCNAALKMELDFGSSVQIIT